ncbi:MAG: penicillin-binding protein 1C [Chitinophagaceae bacterium]|nr:penicillin-binding protein 1C [Chitinophagaceae bacterium]
MVHFRPAVKKWLIVLVAAPLVFFLLDLIFPFPPPIAYSTIITDAKGEVIHAYLTPDEKWRMKTELEEISPLLRKTIVEKEDKYFYYHPGINPLAMVRSLVKNVFRMKRTSGASTITMQVARILEPKKRSYPNKMVEMFRALQLELRYSKDEILQLYLNLVPYGGNIEGVKSAAVLYLKKSPDHLSLAEIVALSIIPNRPSSLVPGKNNTLIVAERNKWLRKFASDAVFTEKEISDALEEPFTATRTAAPVMAPHLCNRVRAGGGAIIRTHLQMNIQLKVEKLVSDYSQALALKNIRNAAVIVIDNSTQQIITYIGSSNFKNTIDAGQVNGARAVRQPGSTLKPLLYALCIDEGLMTPKRIVTDAAINYNGYAPENYDKQFNGYVTMEYALEHSLNIPAVKGLRAFGKDKFVQKLAACGFRQVKRDQRKLGLSMILGGCGASLEELTGLYALFAHEGVFTQPSFIRGDSTRKRTRIVSPAAAFMINDILSKVNRPDFPLNWQSTEKMPKIAWKTGTSYGRRDAWSIGYNKRYTVGVWAGNFSAEGVPELSGANIATPLLFRIFNTIDYDSDEEWFQQPKDSDMRMVCSETGLVPEESCTNIAMDYFIPLVSSSGKCNNMQEVVLSADGQLSYCKTCMPESGYRKKMYKIIPPEMQLYYEEKGIAYEQIPFHNPACEKIFRDGKPVITFPAAGAEYFINRKDPEPLQLTCNTGNDVRRVYWYINDQFFKSSGARAKQFFVPAEGPVKISCTDDKGRNRDIWIRVKYINL